MDEANAVQDFEVRYSEEIIEESKFSLLFKNFSNLDEPIVTGKVKLLFIDAEWWVTVGQYVYNSGNRQYYLPISVHISRSPDQVVELKNCKFSFAVNIPKSDEKAATNWHQLTNIVTIYESKVSLYVKTVPKDISMDMKLTIKRFEKSVVSTRFFNPMKGYSNIINNYYKMATDSSYHDFKFMVKGEEIKVQKCVLAAASPVFNRLFNSDLQEAGDNVCEINKIEPEVFKNLLQFIYSTKLPENLSEVAQALYEAADYYDLPQLKEVCAIEIRSKLSKENAIDIYCWAWIYDDLEELKKDSWKVVKREVLHIYFRMKNEPLSPVALKELMKKKLRFQQYMDDLKEVPETEEKLKP